MMKGDLDLRAGGLVKPQPIYVITRTNLEIILELVAGEWGDYPYAYGISSPDSLPPILFPCFEGKECVRISKLAQILRDLETSKMIGGANRAIDLIIKEMNDMRGFEGD